MPIFNITPSEAREQHQQGATLVDVRSTREFAAGHPEGALNIPLNEHDEETGQMIANPDFMRVMQSAVPTDQPVILSCQSGGRSLRAARMLESFGYAHVSNLLGGFKGKTDPVDGRTTDPGWHASGLPVETAAAPGASYAELVNKADAAE
jgi:rhodanese-related sulfurtransferase